MPGFLERLMGRPAREDGDAFVLRRVFPPSSRLGTSFLGGKPRLPENIPWPTTQEGEGLSFLGQVDLDALPATRAREVLPGGALLFFVSTADDFCDHDQPGASAVLHVTGNLAAIPPREPPENVPPVYGHSADYYVPWVPAKKGGPALATPRSFPCWNVEAKSIRSVPEDEGPAVRDAEGLRHDNAAAAARWSAYAAAFGPPPLWEYPTWWEEQDLPRLGQHPLPLARKDEAWMPDDAWPYAWINIGIFAAQSMEQLRRGGSPEHARLLAEAAAWHDEAVRAGLFTAVQADRKTAFRAWSPSIGPFVHSFKLDGLNKLTDKAFVAGADALLGYAPDAALSLLPARLLPVLAGRHAPFARRKSLTQMVQHQMLGHGRSVQGAPERLGGDHLLLAQFDSDDGMFWMWGDVGVLQFWIRPADLKAGRFENCKLTMEGH